MRGLINDYLRSIISWTITILGLLLTRLQRVRIACFSVNQKRLKRKYGIAGATTA